jgi:hypothetical protein
MPETPTSEMETVTLDALRSVMRSSTGTAEAWYQLGLAAFDAGQLGEARFALTQSVTSPSR